MRLPGWDEMGIISTLVELRQRIMWTYLAVTFILLTAPLPQGLGELKVGTPSAYIHFILFLFLAVVVEFAHLFSLDRKTLINAGVFALVMELIQLLLPYRSFEIMDMMANISGAFTGYAILTVLKAKGYLNTKWTL